MKYLMILIVVLTTNCAMRDPVVEFHKPSAVICSMEVEKALDAFKKRERRYTRPTFEVWIRTLECLDQNRSRLDHSDES